jgi:surface protein
MEMIHRCGPDAVGLQAFKGASAFNANIGAWNTASATTLSYVIAFSAVARKRSAVVRSVGLQTVMYTRRD